jgi:ubiquinone/menaquinone biosynthesis C-methylase UbiE
MRRVLRSHAEARASYNRLSRWYDALANRSEAPFRRLGLTLLDVRPGERVLEIGCGTGHGLAYLGWKVEAEGLVVGLDIADGMTRIAAQRLQNEGIDATVGICVGDAMYPCFASASFDAIFMSFTLELFDTPDLPRILSGCRALLRAGGRIGVVSLAQPEGRAGLAVRLYEWLHDLAPRWLDCRPISVSEILAQGGFDVATVRRGAMWGLPVVAVVALPRVC